MSNRTLQTGDRAHPTERPSWQLGVEGWLRLALAEEFGSVAREGIPDDLLRLLPEE